LTGCGKDEAVQDIHREPERASQAPGGEREDTTGPDEPLLIAAPEQFKALAHPLRQRMLFALSERATISQLASALASNKGNIAHHLRVLREAGMVTAVGTRQVRGGTEQYYQRVHRIMRIADSDHRANLPIAFQAIAEEIVAAEPDPFLVLRHVRLTAAQAERVTATLAELASQTEDAGTDQPRYGLLLGFFRQPPAPD
jgi:DNA-binding transcriptional ArsR family regulator